MLVMLTFEVMWMLETGASTVFMHRFYAACISEKEEFWRNRR